MSETSVNCPNCGNIVPVDDGYIPWCEKCNWNINPEVYYQKEKNAFDAFYEKIGMASKERLFSKIMKENCIIHKTTPYTVLAYLISSIIYLPSIYLIMASFYILFKLDFISGSPFISGAPHKYAISVILFSLGIGILPKFRKAKEIELMRNEFPALYKCVDMISDRLNSKRIKQLYANYDFNACDAKTGIRQKNHIVLGIPFFSILDIDEKIAVIAHKIAHCRNNDVSRQWFVNLAMNSLSQWYDKLSAYGRLIVTMPVTWPLSMLLKMIIHILGLVIWKDCQKAEYFADGQAAGIAGVDATISASAKFYFRPAFFEALKQAVNFSNTYNLFDLFRMRVENIPDREIQRVKMSEQIETAGMHSSHPPALLRNRFISEKIKTEESLKPSEEDIRQIGIEFGKAEELIQYRLLNEYREYKAFDYYGNLIL